MVKTFLCVGDVYIFMPFISMNYKLFNRRGSFSLSLSFLSLSLVDGKITAKAMIFFLIN